jgi:hypothetical protein
VRGCLARLERLEHQTRLDLYYHGRCLIEVSQNAALQNDSKGAPSCNTCLQSQVHTPINLDHKGSTYLSSLKKPRKRQTKRFNKPTYPRVIKNTIQGEKHRGHHMNKSFKLPEQKIQASRWRSETGFLKKKV